jgi:hypothetical protein
MSQPRKERGTAAVGKSTPETANLTLQKEIESLATAGRYWVRYSAASLKGQQEQFCGSRDGLTARGIIYAI